MSHNHPLIRLLAALAIVSSCDLANGAETPSLAHAAVFAEDLPGLDPGLARDVAAQVAEAGYSVEFINAHGLTNEASLNPHQLALLVLPGARSLPASAAPSIEKFLNGGGSLLALGLPAWDSASFEVNGRWILRAEYERALNSQRAERAIAGFPGKDLSAWSRSADRVSPAQYELADIDGTRAAHVRIDNLAGWDNLASPTLTNRLPETHTLTCFRAKGTPRTKQLALEWMEQDGSRWIATVNLATNWQQYGLAPEAFQPWLPPAGRGGEGDHLLMKHAVRFVFGLARSHTALEGNQQEYWIADLGTAPSPFGDKTLPQQLKPPHIENFSPGYLFYPLNPNEVGLSIEPVFHPQAANERAGRFSLADGVRPGQPRYGIHPRPRGIGFRQQRPWRWQPLLVARSSSGEHLGTIAALLVQNTGSARGGVSAAFTPADTEFYRRPQVRQTLQQVLAAMRRGVFLQEGGAEFFTVFEDQSFHLGGRVENFSQTPQSNVIVRVSVRSRQSGETVHTRTWELALAGGAEKTVEESWRPPQWPAGGLEVGAELLVEGKSIDHLSHEINVWQPKPKPQFIEARDGGFWLKGKEWKVNGVNYMPSSGIGLRDWRLFEQWVGPGAYDPEVIQRDLERIKAMNLNAISIFIYHASLSAQHLLDLLRRAESLGLHVNLSLRPGTPLDFRWKEMKELIEFYRLAQNDTVFAYDLAWEPSHGNHAAQQRAYGARWNEWVLNRYGNLASAEQAWGVLAPQDSGASNSIAVPPRSQLLQDGPWRKLVVDYRRFLDELLGAKYAEARRLVKSIDPNHAVSFRMSEAGDPTFNGGDFLPYEFYGLRGAVDIWEPEAYGRIGDWDTIKHGRFTTDYARLCDAGKPFMWAEMGCSVLDPASMKSDPDRLQFQARYFRDFYRLLQESGADGVCFWWYPGGYRCGENSDFGIINPDGTDRPVSRVIRTEGARFLNSAKPARSVDQSITVDRQRDARGVFGIYETVKEDYWREIEGGKTPALKWASKPYEK